VWAVRSATPRPLVGKGSAEADELPARGRLATDLAALVEAGRIELVSGLRIHTIELAGDRARLTGDQMLGGDLIQARDLTVEADEVIAATGFRPDHTVAAELRLALEPGLESAAALGPIMDPNVHTCGTVPAHGIAELAHPNPAMWSWDEELRPRPDLPVGHRLPAGPLGGGRPGRRPGRRPPP
jgi:hypothetical protein